MPDCPFSEEIHLDVKPEPSETQLEALPPVLLLVASEKNLAVLSSNDKLRGFEQSAVADAVFKNFSITEWCGLQRTLKIT